MTIDILRSKSKGKANPALKEVHAMLRLQSEKIFPLDLSSAVEIRN